MGGRKSVYGEERDKEKWLLTEKLGENRSQTRTDNLCKRRVITFKKRHPRCVC